MSEEVREVGGKKVRVEVSDVEEVREVFEAIVDFVRKLKEPIKELIEVLASAVDGRKLGEEVAALYESLKSRGVPEDLIREIVREFINKKFEAVPSIGSIIESLRSSPRRIRREVRGEEVERSIEVPR